MRYVAAYDLLDPSVMEGSEVLVWAGLRKQLLHEHTNGSCGWLTGVTAHDSVAVLSFFRSLDNPEKEQSAGAPDADFGVGHDHDSGANIS